MQPIRKSNLVNEVFDQLLRMLASQAYPAGSKLPSETRLCETLGVSRNTVRTAMSKVIALGLVENQQGYGYRVRDLNIGVYASAILPGLLANAADIQSALEFRIAMESTAARLAAQRATPEDLRRIRHAYESAADCLLDWDAFVTHDLAFHRCIAQASKNPLFLRTGEMIEAMYAVWQARFVRRYPLEPSHATHGAIWRAIASHDAEAAGAHMRRHLEEVLGLLTQPQAAPPDA